MRPTLEELFKIYSICLRSRYLDEELQKYHYANPAWKNPDGIVRILHSALGNELGQGAVAGLLRREDFLIARYRGYAALLGKGMAPERIIAELLRRRTGAAKGLGDVSLFSDPENNIFGSSLILGSNFSTAIGLAFAKKIKNENGIMVLFFGDGEASRTTFGGALNLASLWNLPLLFVCENDGLSLDATLQETSATPTLAERANGYNIRSLTVHISAPLALCERAKETIKEVRETGRPFLLEIMEDRFTHQSTFHTDEPFLAAMLAPEKDPFAMFGKELARLGVADLALRELEREARQAIDAAKSVAESAESLSAEEFKSIYYE